MIVLDRERLGLIDLVVERNAFGRQVASFEAAARIEGDDEPFTRRLHPRARGSPRPGPASLSSPRSTGIRCSPRGPCPRRVVPSGADRRHAGARAVPSSSSGRSRVSGHSKWSTIKHKKGAADAKRGKLFTKLSRVDPRRGQGGWAGPCHQHRARERDREGALLLDAEGQHRPRDRQGLRRRHRRRGLRDRRLRGLRPRGRRGARRGADRQPQPHRGRRAASVHEARGQPRRHGRGRLAVRAAGDRARPGRGCRRGRVVPRRRGGRRRRRRPRRLRLPGLERARAALGCPARRSRPRASPSSLPSSRWCRR